MSNDLLRGHLYNEYKRYQRLYNNCDDTDARIWYRACMSTLDSLAFRFLGVQLVDVMNLDCDNHSSAEICKK